MSQAQSILLADGREVQVALEDGHAHRHVVEVEADGVGTWRFGVDRHRRASLLTSQDADGNLADIEIPTWMNEVLSVFEIRGVNA